MVKRHWMTLVLTLSLSLNLLVLGLIIGRSVWPDHRHPSPLIWALEDIDPRVREQLEPVLRQDIESTLQQRRALREISNRIRELLAVEQLDEVALTQALTALRSISGSYQQQLHQTVVPVLAQLEPAQRIAVAGRLLRAGHDGRRPPAGHRPPPNGYNPPPPPR